MNTPNFDLYIITAVSDFDVLNTTIPYIKKNIAATQIYIVAKEKPTQKNLIDCNFLYESSILDGLSYDSVANIITSLGGDKKNTGWYLQQFIKLGISNISKNKYYLVWDADTIPLRPLDFFDSYGHPFFNLKREYKKLYFDTIQQLLSLRKNIRESFISEHMIFDVELTNELIQKINDNYNLKGANFWEKILFACFSVKSTDQHAFSEFETYGVFITKFHKNSYTHRKLKTLRRGTEFFGRNISEKLLTWCAETLDTISFEKYSVSNHCICETPDENYMKNHTALEFLEQLWKKDKNELRKALLMYNKEAYKTCLDKVSIYEADFIFIKTPHFFPLINVVKKNKLLRCIFLAFRILLGRGQCL